MDHERLAKISGRSLTFDDKGLSYIPKASDMPMTKKKFVFNHTWQYCLSYFFCESYELQQREFQPKVPRGLCKERIPLQNNAELFYEFTSLLLLFPYWKTGITVSKKKLISLRDKVSRWSSAFRQNLRQTTLGRDGRRLLRLDDSRSNKTVWNKQSCKRCCMSVRSTVRCTKHPDNPSSEHVNSRYLTNWDIYWKR